jgi:predicted TIM-barrel fold metal-dependent hydrolase
MSGLLILLRLVEQGVGIQATVFGRVNFDIAIALRELYSANPDALMFGSDLPSTRAPRPFLHSDISLIIDCLGEEPAAAVMHANAALFYRI